MLTNSKIFFFLVIIVVLFYLLTEFTDFYTYKGTIAEKFSRFSNGHKTKSFTTVFTLYYRLAKSKHKSKSYETWSNNFFKIISSPVVVFTDFKSLPSFLNITKNLNKSATFYVTNNVWNIMSILEKSRNKHYIEKYKTIQYKLDPEKRKHSPELYAIWNLKHFIGNLVAQLNPYESRFFIYTDIGGWRSGNFENWPSIDFAKNVSFYLNDTCLYNQVYSGTIGGGFFAGSKTALEKVSEKFYEIHDKWFERNTFVGKDQNIMRELAFKAYPKYVMRLKTWGYKCLKYYSRWFFYESFFQYNPNCSFNLATSILKTK